MAVVRARDLGKTFKGMTLFEDVNLEIEQGRTYALTGPNGAGKSVLLKLLCQFVAPTTGSVEIDPYYLDHKRTFPDKFGVSINGPTYISHMTGADNLLELANIRKRIGSKEVRESLELVGLPASLKQKVRSYSQGMKQKLALAQAFMEDPEVLILDEPFNALDESSVANIKSVLLELKQQGKTILFTSHSDADVTELADATFRITDRRLISVPVQ